MRATRSPAKGLERLVRLFALVFVAPFLLLGLGYGLLMVVPRGPPPPLEVPSGSFAFAALGDAPYSPLENVIFDVVLDDLAGHDLTAVVHVGDIFSEPCTDEAYRVALGRFDRLPHPVIYTPGDNEWTDCFDGSSETSPYNRLGSIRRILFADPGTSLGGRRMPLEHQGSDTLHSEFPENARWTHDGVVFATVHLVGSFNAMRPFPGRTETEAKEPLRRTAAAEAWMRETFAVARADEAEAVVVAFHAQPFFEQPPGEPGRRPFEPFVTALEEEVAAFARPVLAIHGDWHDYTVDRPLVDQATGRPLPNLTRLQVPGSPAVGWVHVTVTPGAAQPFAFEPRVTSRVPFR